MSSSNSRAPGRRPRSCTRFTRCRRLFGDCSRRLLAFGHYQNVRGKTSRTNAALANPSGRYPILRSVSVSFWHQSPVHNRPRHAPLLAFQERRIIAEVVLCTHQERARRESIELKRCEPKTRTGVEQAGNQSADPVVCGVRVPDIRIRDTDRTRYRPERVKDF